MVVSMRFLLAFLIVLWLSPASAQWGGGGGATINNTVTGAERVLCSIRSANMNVTTDQVCTIPAAVTAWAPLGLIVTNCSATPTLAVGGFYPASSKAGTAMVAATQAYSTLTSSSIVLLPTLASTIATTRYGINSTYFSLTTAAGVASTCDVYLTGVDLT
jgi:hypothetical protein